MPALLVLFGVGFVLLLGLLIWFAAQAEKKRRAELAALAAQRGWLLTERDDRWVDRFEGSAPFGQGHNRQARNVLTGRHDGRPCVIFDYRYDTTETSTDAKGNTSSREVTHSHSVFALETGVAFPVLSVAPEGFFTRLVDLVVGADIDFEWDEFNRAFRVTSTDRRFASDVMHQQMMEFLMPHRKSAWALRNGAILLTTSGRYDLATLDDRLGFVDSVLDLVPDFVWENARHSPPGASPAPPAAPFA